MFSFVELLSAVVVFIALDIVLTQIFTDLYFDNMQWLAALVFQPVFRADRYVGALIFMHGDDAITIGHCRRTGHHHPVFGAPLMALQAEACAGSDLDTLDFETVLIFLQHGITAPRPVHLGVIDMLGRPALLECIDHFAHPLGLVAFRDEHGIGGFDNTKIFHADRGDQPFLGTDQAVTAVQRDDVALQRVAAFVLGGNFVYGMPTADIVPADVARNERNAIRFFQHAVIDGNGGHGGKMFFHGLLEAPCGAAPGKNGLHDPIDLGQVPLYFGKNHRGTPHKHAGVPVIIALP